MKFKQFIRLKILGFALLAGLPLFSQDLPVLTYRETDRVYLRWPALHETDLDGYHVYRRSTGAAEWQKLTEQPVGMIRSVARIREMAGFKTEMFLQLFGAVNPVRDIDNPAYQNVINDEASLSFLDIMTLINPEFGPLMGVVHIDSLFEPGGQIQYKITTVRRGVEQDYAISTSILADVPDKIPVVTGLEGEGGHQSAMLIWDKNQKDLEQGSIVSYAVYRSEQLLGEYERANLYGLLPVTVTSGDIVSRQEREEYRDRYLENGRTYYYYVRAVNAFGIEGPASVTVEIVPGDTRIPPSPYALQAEPFGTGLKLSWKSRDGVPAGFEVFRSTDRSGSYARIYPLDDILLRPDLFMIDIDVVPATPYYYYINAVGSAGQRSDPSDTLAVFLEDRIPPQAPGPVRALAEEDRIILTWPPNPENDVIGYQVERASDDAFRSRFLLTNDILADTIFTDLPPAKSETTYGYVVYAIDRSYNRSDPSEMVKARLPDLTPPSPPIITRLERKGKLVLLEWTRSTEKDLAAYRVYRADGKEDAMIAIGMTFTNNFSDSLRESGRYFYSVSAIDSAGNESKRSMPLSLTYDRNEVPERSPAGKAERAGNFIRVEWEAATQPGTAGYVVTREAVKTGKKVDVAQVKAGVTSYTDRFADVMAEYVYHIRTYDERWRMSEALMVRYEP